MSSFISSSGSGEQMPDYISDSSQVNVLGLCGQAGSGKDYFARAAFQRVGFVPIALANPFKVEEVVLNKLPVEEVWGNQEKSEEVRSRLQIRGTEQGRDIHGQHIWLHTAEAMMYFFLQYGADKFVITDVRFPNEAAWIHNLDGQVYRLVGRGGETGKQADHRSETEVSRVEADRVIDNSPSRENEALYEFYDHLNEDFNHVR